LYRNFSASFSLNVTLSGHLESTSNHDIFDDIQVSDLIVNSPSQ
jgi:hypothetical protein